MKGTPIKALLYGIVLALSATLAFAGGVPVPTDTAGWTQVTQNQYSQGILIGSLDIVNDRVTVFSGGRASKVVFKDNEKAVDATYVYENGSLAHVVDMYGNKTDYNAKGQATFTWNSDGFMTSETKFNSFGGVSEIWSYSKVAQRKADGTIDTDSNGNVIYKAGTTLVGITTYKDGLAIGQKGLMDPTAADGDAIPDPSDPDNTSKHIHNTWFQEDAANPHGKDLVTYNYVGRKLTNVKDNNTGDVTYYRADGRVDYTKDKNGVLSSRNNYDTTTLKLLSQDTFTTGDKGGAILTQQTTFDRYGRENEVWNATNGIIDKGKSIVVKVTKFDADRNPYVEEETVFQNLVKKYTYNDGAQTEQVNPKGTNTANYKIPVGGLMWTEDYDIGWSEDGKTAKVRDTTMTYYHNGNKATPGDAFKTNTSLLANSPLSHLIRDTAPDITARVTNTNGINGTLSIEDNMIFLTVSSQGDLAALHAMLTAAQSGLDTTSQAYQDLEAMKTLVANAPDAGIKIAIGSVNDAKVNTLYSPTNGVDANTSGVWNDSFMTSNNTGLIDKARNQSAVNLKWSYMGISTDSTTGAKTIFAFANALPGASTLQSVAP